MNRIGFTLLTAVLFLGVTSSCQNFFWSHNYRAETPTTENVYYGLLYNWYAATDTRKITSSDDWRLSTWQESVILRNYCDPVNNNPTTNIAGIKLKETGNTYWYTDSGVTNDYKFNARGAGSRNLLGGWASIRNQLLIWNTKIVNPSTAGASSLVGGSNNYDAQEYIYSPMKTANSIRLIKDFTTLSHGQTGTYTGNDGKVYRTICIGTQEWLADNLMETRFRNGDIIPWHGANPANYFTNAEWAALTTAGVCAYDNDETNVAEGFSFPNEDWYDQGTLETIYYFASDGDDGNDGLSISSPKQTISAANSLTLSVGDAVLFKSTDTFEGTITAQSGVTYGAYGLASSKPIVYGSDEITGWSLHSGSIYKASYATTINQLFVNDQRLLASREPDSGFFTVDVAPTTSQITSDELNGALNYTGTQCIIHSSSYGLETKAVTGSSSTTITLASAPFGDVTANEKFILVGKLEFLDEAGEWYYDAAADLVYVWLPDSADPSGYTMRGSVTDYGMTASYKYNFTIKDIQFAQQKIAGVSLTSSTDYTIDDITVNYADQEGIVDYSCENGTYTNNTITGVNHQGIESETSDSMLIQNNTITNIALFEDLGLSGIGAWYNGSGVYMNGDGNQIYSNRLDEIGYDGIAFYGENTVKYNYITNFCRTKNDGGGIYTSAPVNYGNENNKGSIVEYNTILYGWGVDTNVDANANGVYLDESSGGITVRYNNVGHCTGWGIFFHKGNNHIGTDNVLFANATGFINTYKGDYTQFKNNYIYGLSGQLLAQHVNSSPVVTTSDIDSNNYVNHYNTLNFNVDWTGSKNFAYWKTNTGFDLNTAYDTLSLGSGIDEKFIVNSTANPVTWYKNNSESVVDAFTGDTLEATYVLQPYSSKVITGKYIGLFLPYADDSIPPVPTVTDSLIAWYDFEDAGTVLVDEHTNNLDGTNKNSSLVDRNVTPVTGLPGNAYPYISTGLSRSLVSDNALLDFTDEFSISAFVNVTSLSNIRTICSKQNEFSLSLTTTGALEMRVYENGGTTFVTISSPTSAIATGNNYFVEVKALGTNLKSGYELYINGVKQTLSYAGSIAELTNGIIDTANDFVVGYSYNTSATMYGNISQLVIHGYETPEEVSADLYNSGAGINY